MAGFCHAARLRATGVETEARPGELSRSLVLAQNGGAGIAYLSLDNRFSEKEKPMTRILATAAALALLAGGAAFAETHEVRMLNKGSDGARMVFEPSFLQVEPSDTVKFPRGRYPRPQRGNRRHDDPRGCRGLHRQDQRGDRGDA